MLVKNRSTTTDHDNPHFSQHGSKVDRSPLLTPFSAPKVNSEVPLDQKFVKSLPDSYYFISGAGGAGEMGL